MSASLQLASGLKLDPDYVGGGTFALLAKKGWGKTYAMRVMAEEFAKARVPFVCLDPMDAFWGLRASKDGKAGGGLEIPIFGGPHGDVPLEPTAGKLMADLVVDEQLSMVLSIAHFGSRAAERRFAMDFFDHLYRRNSDLVHLLVDEADLFAPQKPQAGDQPLLGVTENIVRRGRNKGIGITLGTQRPAVLNKDVLTQVDGIIVGRMLGPQDRNAIDAWVGEHGDQRRSREIKNELPDLATGECWVWVPEEGVLRKVKIRAARTFDSSPTRKRGALRRSLTLTDVDLAAIAGKVADSVERAKAEDPKELRKQIAQLKRELAAKPEAAPAPEPIEVPVLTNGTADRLEDLAASIRDAAEEFGSKLTRTSTDIVAELQRVRTSAPAAVATPPRRPTPAPRPARPAAEPIDGDLTLGRAERSILSVIVQFPEGRTKTQISILSGYSAKSSSFSNALGKLRSAGLISPAGREPITATAEGAAAAGDVDPVPTGPDLYLHWLGKLGKAERSILEVLYEAHPAELAKEEISERSGYSITSSSFSNALGKLRSLELVEGFKASDSFFEFFE